jgi:hypothetical protein
MADPVDVGDRPGLEYLISLVPYAPTAETHGQAALEPLLVVQVHPHATPAEHEAFDRLLDLHLQGLGAAVADVARAGATPAAPAPPGPRAIVAWHERLLAIHLRPLLPAKPQSAAAQAALARLAAIEAGLQAASKEPDAAKRLDAFQAAAQRPAQAAPPPPPRGSNRKITLPYPDGSLFGMPNIQNHGVRSLARIAAGDAAWQADPSGRGGQLAVFDGKAIGRIDFTPGQETAERALLDRLSPRAIKTMVATSRLIIEGTNRDPLNRGATIRVSEIARAMGYKPGAKRYLEPATLRQIAGDVYTLSKVETWAADGPYDPKTQHWQSGWVAPLIVIAAVHAAQTSMDGPPLPFEFDAMLGRNWAQALLSTDLLQIAPGLMELHDENPIRLAWYYLTEFRYRMTKPKAGTVRKVADLCAEARIDIGQPKHRGRFLSRLEQWHAQLAEQAIIGAYTRSPATEDVEHDNAWTPARIFAEGEYHVEPPTAILEAYERARQKTLNGPKGKRGARLPRLTDHLQVPG